MRLLSILIWTAIVVMSGGPANAASELGWSREGDRIVVAHTGVSFSTKTDSLSLVETGEFSAKGQGIDNFAQYRSADGQVFATVYVYYPGLAHSGLTAFATGRIVQESPSVRKLDSNLVTVGGVPNAAIRETFTGYRNNLASAATFMQVGHWIVKLRVSGPDARASEVFAGMDALLAGASFAGDKPAVAAPLLAVSPCNDKDRANARPSSETMESALLDVTKLAVLQLGGPTASDKAGDPNWRLDHLGQSYCLAEPASGAAGRPWILHPTGQKPATADVPRTELLALIDDAGGMIEVLKLGKSYRILLHQIGFTKLLGAFESIPSDAQIRAIVAGKDKRGARSGAGIQLFPGKSPAILIGSSLPHEQRPTI